MCSMTRRRDNSTTSLALMAQAASEVPVASVAVSLWMTFSQCSAMYSVGILDLAVSGDLVTAAADVPSSEVLTSG